MLLYTEPTTTPGITIHCTYYTVVVSGQKYNNIRIVDNIHTYSTFIRAHTNDILYRCVIKTKICRNQSAAYTNNDYKRN